MLSDLALLLMADVNCGCAIFQLGILQVSQNTNLETNILRKGAACVQSVHIFWYSSSAVLLLFLTIKT